MKTFKTTILTLVAGLFAFCAQGQSIVTSAPIEIYNSVASNCPVGTLTIDCSKQQNIAIQLKFSYSGAGVENTVVQFYPMTVPGTRATTPHNNGFIITAAGNGAAWVTVATNFNCKGYSRLDLGILNNGNASLSTNIISYSIKPNAP